ncbi:unnamed protein product [Spirodela intermedia]|uniref:Protein FAR1-RELATED SEQUENCE n=1 Tax=Spirodela intermedia TaxID=51605 RepID=A0A7I8IQJ1_SPIIN|nr:unnamed protein product [Spirodela intermedia]CAA6660248.1 unnamed protein product [Spirodela intermedia]
MGRRRLRRCGGCGGCGDGEGSAAGEGAGVEEQQEPQLGMEFDSLESASAFYFNYAQSLGFRVRASRFRTSRRDESIIMRRFVCYKEGEGCQAMFEVVRKGPDRWVAAKLFKDHSHAFTGAAVRELKPRKKKVEPVDFPVDAVTQLGRGSCDDDPKRQDYWGGGGEAFNLLEYLKRMQAKNPGFFYSLQVDEQSNLVTNVFWADARARAAYGYFGDAVAFDTTYRKSKQMMPFISFTGVNHHLQPLIFGCGIIFEESEPSFSWLLETFSVAMRGRAPLSLVTEPDENLRAAVLRVFPTTRHRFCKRRILHRAKEELPQLCSTPATWRAFKAEVRRCIDESETVEDFESCWGSILGRYNLGGSSWIQSLYELREHWAAAFLKDAFFAEMSPAQRSETMHKFFLRNFETRASIRDFLCKFDQAMAGQFEKEVQSDYANLCSRPVLKTSMEMEKQAAEMYTKTIFAIFQEELLQSSSALPPLNRMTAEDPDKVYRVDLCYPEKRASCSCRKFDFSGILCRHILSVFSSLHISKLPEDYFLRRWTRAAKSGPTLLESNSTHLPIDRRKAFSCLCLEMFKYAEEGATSSAAYTAAKDALRNAFAEVVAAKKGFTG